MYTVRNIMSSPVLTTSPDATVDDALHRMREAGVSSIIVEIPNDSPGIMTKRDIITKVVSQDKDTSALKVSQIMSSPILTIPVDASLRQCSQLMQEANVRRLPVEEEGQIVGIISDTDIFMAVEATGWGPEDEQSQPLGEDRLFTLLAHKLRDTLGDSPGPDEIQEAILVGLRQVYQELQQ